MSLRRRVGRVLAHPSTLARLREAGVDTPSQFAIAESFEVWVVDAPAILDSPPDADLRSVARRSVRVHHQLLVDGKAVAYVRSIRRGVTRIVDALSLSPTAKRIDDVIDRLDATVRQRAVVRLLRIPSEQVVALWIVPLSAKAASRVWLVAVPPQLRLSHRGPIDSKRLLTALRRTTRLEPTRED